MGGQMAYNRKEQQYQQSLNNKVSTMPSGGSSKVKPGLLSTLFFVFDAPCFSLDSFFNFLSQKLYHHFSSQQKFVTSIVIYHILLIKSSQ